MPKQARRRKGCPTMLKMNALISRPTCKFVSERTMQMLSWRSKTKRNLEGVAELKQKK